MVGITFLPLMDVMGATVTFAAYAVVCFVGWWAVYFFYPETMGLELEDVGRLLDKGWGVRDSRARNRERERVRMVREPGDEAEDGI